MIWVLLVAACCASVAFVAAAITVFKPYCPHARVRCIHGDEILYGAGGRRVRCLDCGRALDRPLPQVCTFTGQPH